MTDLYVPLGVMRQWPAAIDPLTRRVTHAGVAVGSSMSIGYVPVYASLDDLIDEHGDVPYQVVKRVTKEPAP